MGLNFLSYPCNSSFLYPFLRLLGTLSRLLIDSSEESESFLEGDEDEEWCSLLLLEEFLECLCSLGYSFPEWPFLPFLCPESESVIICPCIRVRWILIYWDTTNRRWNKGGRYCQQTTRWGSYRVALSPRWFLWCIRVVGNTPFCSFCIVLTLFSSVV